MEHVGEVIERVGAQHAEHMPAAAAAPSRNGIVTTANPLDMPTEHFQAGLDRRRSNRKALMEWVAEALVEGVDYGRIQTRRGPSKPSLFKPGAEKICGMLGITVHYPTLAQYEQTALQGIALSNIILRCELQDSSGNVVADGVGARSLKQDYGDLNKALKMAAKSAHIDATLRMAGLSEVFTQDLEDIAGTPAEPSTQSAKPSQPAKPAHNSTPPQTISADQFKALERRIEELELDPERVRSWVVRATRGGVDSLSAVTPALHERLLKKLPEWAEAVAAESA
ncbi:hypothetical protein CKO15_09845 [Halorhodospira abdelmalekii]|uniref:hypothetical protein n=1 Tax=Halorhodospira abdelmalekii TaxID=421629 RepID=UPI001906C526|nr:hypothetical protein [Halorhodospira abdelmalekii]MBK1735580.1 hypothetical protein [Halorhodospira abdelmalekii]